MHVNRASSAERVKGQAAREPNVKITTNQSEAIMSYVPKYILKRMVPEDALKKVKGGVELKLINMVTTIPVGQAPGDIVDLLEIKVNGQALSRDLMNKIEVSWEGNKYTLANIRDAGVVPVNVEAKFFVPVTDVKVGENVKIEINVPQFSVNIEFERVLKAGDGAGEETAAPKPVAKAAEKPAAPKPAAKAAEKPAAKPAAGKKKK